MSTTIKHSFERKLITLSLTELQFTKKSSAYLKQGRKYSQILSSIREIGLIEPPVVTLCERENKYLLLDGHLRIMALEELGEKEVNCLVSVEIGRAHV